MSPLKPILAALALGAAALSSHAAAPTYAGTLQSGTFNGTVMAESGPFGTPERWSLWTFTAPFMADVSITVTPDSPGFDPYIAVFYGTEGDLAHYWDLTTGSLNSVMVAHADGAMPFGPAGIGDAAAIRFNNIYGHESFVLAIADYTDGTGVGPLSYTVTATVPEPSSAALALASLGVVATLARRRRST